MQAVVGVLADAPALVVSGQRRVVEDPEQDERVSGQMSVEPILVEAEPDRDAAQQGVAERGDCVDVVEDRVAQSGRSGREEVRPVQRPSGPHPRIVGRELLAEVDAFLHVGATRGELAAHREPTSPGAPALGHGDVRLLVVAQGEELPRQSVEPLDHVGGNAVSGHEEEAGGPAGADRSPWRSRGPRRTGHRCRGAAAPHRSPEGRAPASVCRNRAKPDGGRDVVPWWRMDELPESFDVPPGAPTEADPPSDPAAPAPASAPTPVPEPMPDLNTGLPAMPPLGPPYAPPLAPPPPTFPHSPPEDWPWTPPLLDFPGDAAAAAGGGKSKPPDDPRRSALMIAALGAVALLIVGALAWNQSNEANPNSRFIAGASTTTTAPIASDSNSDNGGSSDSSDAGGSSSSDSSSSDSQDLHTTVLDIEAFVAKTRGLQFKQDVDVQLADDNQLTQLLNGEFAKERPSLLETQEVLRALGLVPPTFDVTSAEQTLLNGSVLGFYDPSTKQLVVRGTEITPFVREVLAHELTHALDDQWFNLDRPQLDTADDETGFGFTALTEGDATRVEDAYLATFSGGDRAEAASEQQQLLLQHPEVLSLPEVLLDISQEPYTDGPTLVKAILAAGQQPRLDAAFQQPPTTSEQVMDPSKFLAGEGAVPVPLPTADGAVSNKGVLGAFMLEELMIESGSVSNVDDAIGGWGGDAYVTWIGSTGKTCLRDTFVGDTPAGTALLAQALSQWAPVAGATVDAPAGQPGSLTVCS